MEPNIESQVLEIKEAGRLGELRDKADFRKLLALIIILGGGAFLWIKADPAQVVAYVFGLISVAVGYYFNTSQSSQDKSKLLAEIKKENQ